MSGDVLPILHTPLWLSWIQLCFFYSKEGTYVCTEERKVERKHIRTCILPQILIKWLCIISAHTLTDIACNYWWVEKKARAEPDGTRAETTFCLSPKRTSPFKSAGSSVQSTLCSRGVRIRISNAAYTTLRGRVRVLATHSIRQFPLHFPFRASPCAITFRTQYNIICFGVYFYKDFNVIHPVVFPWDQLTIK